MSQWKVYVPRTPGGWFDWWTEKRIASNTTAKIDAPLNRIPLLIRAGSVVPLGPAEQYVHEDQSGDLELRVYPGASGDFVLYEDEGTNYNYEKGQRSIIPLHWDDEAGVLSIGKREGTFPGMFRHRKITIHLAGDSLTPDRIEMYDGDVVQICLSRCRTSGHTVSIGAGASAGAYADSTKTRPKG